MAMSATKTRFTQREEEEESVVTYVSAKVSAILFKIQQTHILKVQRHKARRGVAGGPAAARGCHQLRGYATGKVSEHKGIVGKDARPDHVAKYPGHESSENPRAIFASSVLVRSAITHFTRPMFPFSAPCKQRPQTLSQRTVFFCRAGRRERKSPQDDGPKERERPNRIIEMIVPARHDKRTARRTGLRLMWSERRFQ
ncbi:hypothetical protein BC826DRAFT_163959 [Russula brevipes]|nr:hypothetical protein BC826DRAFT_163959 [Russula brevipes]